MKSKYGLEGLKRWTSNLMSIDFLGKTLFWVWGLVGEQNTSKFSFDGLFDMRR